MVNDPKGDEKLGEANIIIHIIISIISHFCQLGAKNNGGFDHIMPNFIFNRAKLGKKVDKSSPQIN